MGEILTLRELRSELAVWQSRMRLNDWRIHLRWSTKADEKMDGLDGCCYWVTEHSVAEILIDKGADDKLGTLVHELLHIKFEGHRLQPKSYDALYEKAINDLTAVLLGRAQ